MLKDIIHVQALPNHQLHLRFEDNIEGTIVSPSPASSPRSKTHSTSPLFKSIQNSARSSGQTAQISIQMSYIPSSPNNPSQISPPSKLFNSNPLYLGQADLTHLGAFLEGYFFARRQSGIPETQQEKEFAEFQHWVEKKFNVNYIQPWEKNHPFLFT